MRVGIPAACVAYCIKFWCQHKAANGKDIHDGKAWVYNSAKAWSELIPYMTEKQIRTALDKLKDAGIVAVRNLNQKQYDQTLWYAHLELETVATTANCPNGKMGFPNGQMEMPEREDGFAQTGRPIPVEIPNTIPSKAYALEAPQAVPAAIIPEQPKRAGSPKSGARGSRIPANWTPTPKDYAFANGEGLTREEINREADRFRDYWTAASGRNACKLDWEATWRNWLRSDFRKPSARAVAATVNAPRGAFDRVVSRVDASAPSWDAAGRSDLSAFDANAIDGEFRVVPPSDGASADWPGRGSDQADAGSLFAKRRA